MARTRKNIKGNIDTAVSESKAESEIPAKAKRGRKVKSTGPEDILKEDDPSIRKKRKITKETQTMPLSTRTNIKSLKKAVYIGAHVSGAGGVQNSINNALEIGSNSFALFLKSQRKWISPPLTAQSCEEFKTFCHEYNYDAQKHILPHASYLINLAQSDPEKSRQAYTCFVDDLHRCEALGIKLYNFHPGSSGKDPRTEAIRRVAEQLNKAHKATKTVVTVLENMAGAGNVIGSTWQDLKDIIELIEDKSRVGVCIDTCHTFAAGYDIRSPDMFQKTMESFDDIVGMSYLKALHLNDSKAPLASNRDVHANIGTGFLGLRAFHNVINFVPFQNMPMILETPIDKKNADGKSSEDKSIWATEIKLLEGLIGADPESSKFKSEEKRLQDLGAQERNKFEIQNEKRIQKSLISKPKRGRRAKKTEDTDDVQDSDGFCSH